MEIQNPGFKERKINERVLFIIIIIIIISIIIIIIISFFHVKLSKILCTI